MTKEEAILLSAYTGFLLVPDFSDVHKFCEDTLGRPIWTHEFADQDVQKEIREKLRPQIMELVQNIVALRPVTRERLEKVWKPCKVCNGRTTLYQHTNTTKLFMNTFGKATTLVTECNACPPYADCCMKGISANSAFRISYCPECGRPLTDEAVDMVMNRLEALYEET